MVEDDQWFNIYTLKFDPPIYVFNVILIVDVILKVSDEIINI